MACLLHCLDNPKDNLSILTNKQFITSGIYADKWAKLSDEPFLSAARKRQAIIAYKDDITIHYSCYSKFFYKTQLERAEKRHSQSEVS